MKKFGGKRKGDKVPEGKYEDLHLQVTAEEKKNLGSWLKKNVPGQGTKLL